MCGPERWRRVRPGPAVEKAKSFFPYLRWPEQKSSWRKRGQAVQEQSGGEFLVAEPNHAGPNEPEQRNGSQRGLLARRAGW